ncbi:hypothetical protein Agabi119p4_5018 [Agaricus bisporus var. burnettii]|uniref:Uncharacterized protein n=1 Tax=Agaricus bisporus var. burnettii TaxID=192524 RepID=A0A8H7KHV6_AGABI|nr:hypothetical protein Agabi119p4_5018 [Agaricus bisporus var. burnettii]
MPDPIHKVLKEEIRNRELCNILTCCDTTPANGNVTPLVSIDLIVYSIMLTGTGLNASVMKEESTYIKLAGGKRTNVHISNKITTN